MPVELDRTGAPPQLQQRARAFPHCVRSAGYPATWQVSLVSGDCGQTGDVGSCYSGIEGRAGDADLLVCENCWPPTAPPFGVA